MGSAEVRLPRASEVPKEISPEGFHSDIVHRYERRSQTQARLLGRLYLEGLSTGDFEPTFRALVGGPALSPLDTKTSPVESSTTTPPALQMPFPMPGVW